MKVTKEQNIKSSYWTLMNSKQINIWIFTTGTIFVIYARKYYFTKKPSEETFNNYNLRIFYFKPLWANCSGVKR